METVKFEELGLYPQLLRAIKEMGFEEATPIQSQAIPNGYIVETLTGRTR